MFPKLFEKPYGFTISIGIIIFVVGILMGFLIDKETHVTPVRNVRENSTRYTFINPLLFTQSLEDQSFPEYISLKETISDYIDRTIAEDKATDVSVYFRNLESSQWISINPNETFSPASMLKVVTLISILRMAESDPELLSRKLIVRGDDSATDVQVRYPVNNPIKNGHSYTVKELTEHLIIESDNVANIVLTGLMGPTKTYKTYDDLRLPRPDNSVEKGYTAEQYSHLFRALYNATYLSRSLSEHVLNLLSQTEFDQGLVAGVPRDTLVSHKFGVRTTLLPNMMGGSDLVKDRELHDCGIVYYPNQPYFLCVMTRGYEFENLETIIKDISKITWEQVTELTTK